MNRTAPVAALCLTWAASAAAQAPSSPRVNSGDPLVLHGCVAAGAESGTYVMNNVYEVDREGNEKTAPRLVNPILYWFKDASGLKSFVGQRVEVAGRIDGLEQTEVELKAGAQKDGGLVVEVEGPGRDVRASTEALPGVAGTAGRTPEKDDVKATLIKVTMGHVKAIDGSCQ